MVEERRSILHRLIRDCFVTPAYRRQARNDNENNNCSTCSEGHVEYLDNLDLKSRNIEKLI